MRRSDRRKIGTILERLRQFRRGKMEDKLFIAPINHPSSPTGLCPCEGSLLSGLLFYVKAGLSNLILAQPFNAPKIWFLRKRGARIGKNVYIAPGVWIDSLFPELLTIDDEVLIGYKAKILCHEFRRDEFRAGRVIIRSGALVGGFAIIGEGVEIGTDATIAAGAVVRKDVPPRSTAIGNPARILKSLK